MSRSDHLQSHFNFPDKVPLVGHITKAKYLQPNVVGVLVLWETELLLVSYCTWIGFIQRLFVKIDLFKLPFMVGFLLQN